MEREAIVRIDKRGRIVIPASFRKLLEIKANDPIFLRIANGDMYVSTMKKRIERSQRTARKYIDSGVSLVDELIADRRREAAKE